MIDKIPVIAERTPLDLLLWRYYRREVAGLAEAALAHNPGLADHGVYLAVGTIVAVERPAARAGASVAQLLVRLYE